MSEPGVSVADQEQMLCTNCFFREAACVDSDRHLKNCMTLTMTIPQSSCTDFEEYETLKVHHQWVKAKIDGKTCLTSWVSVLHMEQLFWSGQPLANHSEVFMVQCGLNRGLLQQ